MTSNEFRADPNLRDSAARILAGEAMRLMLEIVERERPARSPLAVVSDTQANIQLGRVYGYDEALERLRDLGKVPPKLPPDVPLDWNT